MKEASLLQTQVLYTFNGSGVLQCKFIFSLCMQNRPLTFQY